MYRESNGNEAYYNYVIPEGLAHKDQNHTDHSSQTDNCLCVWEVLSTTNGDRLIIRNTQNQSNYFGNMNIIQDRTRV